MFQGVEPGSWGDPSQWERRQWESQKQAAKGERPQFQVVGTKVGRKPPCLWVPWHGPSSLGWGKRQG